MVHHTCMDCQMGFIAKSHEEAEDEYFALPESERDEIDYPDGLVYAKSCPYCGSNAVEAR